MLSAADRASSGGKWGVSHQVKAWAAAVLGLSVTMATLFKIAPSGVADVDFYWHLAYGRELVESGVFPRRDFISWTFLGTAYESTQWLGQVLLYGLSLMGAWGPALAVCASAAVAMCVVYDASIRQGGGVLAGLSMAAWLTMHFWAASARPQVFAFFFMAALVWLTAVRNPGGVSRWHALLMGFAGAAWVNLHGSFAVGLAYLLVWGCGRAVDEWTRREGGWRNVGAAIRWDVVGCAAFAAGTMASPRGVGAWTSTVDVMGLLTTKNGLILEWVPTSLVTNSGQGLLIAVLVLVGVMAFARTRPTVGQTLCTLSCVVMGLTSNRLAWFMVLPVAVEAVKCMASTGLVKALAAMESDLSLKMLLGTALIVGAAVGGLDMTRYEERAEEADQLVYPTAAVRFLKERGIHPTRLFHEGYEGGWLWYRHGIRPGIDGRMDLYRDDHVFRWTLTRQGAELADEFLLRVSPDAYLLPRTDRLVKMLVDKGKATPVFFDGKSVVLLPWDRRALQEKGLEPVVLKELGLWSEEGRVLQTPVKSW